MADGYNRFNAGGPYYYQNHNHSTSHSRNLHHRNGSPINNNRALFQPAGDNPSPNRSPGTHSPASHGQFNSMYNHNSHRQNHALLNGGAGAGAHQNYQQQMNLNKAFGGQNHAHQNHHGNSQHQQDHGTLSNHSGTFGNHQHTISTSTLSNTTPHFTPAHLQNGTPEAHKAIPCENWTQQQREYQKLRMADTAHRSHWHARNNPSVSRTPFAIARAERAEEADSVERRRMTSDNELETSDAWGAMDLSGQGLKGVAPTLFKCYPELRMLYLNWNKLHHIPLQIRTMRNLRVLDLSMNELSYVPPEIGMLTQLKKLSLYDNHIDDLPWELGSLHRLETLGMEGNPLREDYKQRLIEHGTQDMIRYLREHAPIGEPPIDRSWIRLEEGAEPTDNFSVMSWNILCERSGTSGHFGYAPDDVLNWQHRREMILEEMKGRDPDIMCLQEVDVENYNEFFRPQLAKLDYKALHWPKSRAQTMSEREAKQVDGCAIFFKNPKFILLDKSPIFFSREAITRPDMKGSHDVYNRVMPRDHIAAVAFLENRQTGSRMIVANTHLTWEPWFSDIKIVQVAIMMDHLAMLAKKYVKMEPCKDKEVFKYANDDSTDNGVVAPPKENAPSKKYDQFTDIPLLICGDFNSTKDSGVLELIAQGSLSSSHPELGEYNYGDLTRLGMQHPFNLKSAYSAIGELPFTNYTPEFTDVIDWVFYSSNSLQVQSILGQVDPEHMRNMPGWPSHFFPSDHVPLVMDFAVKERKERKQVEANFGNSRKENRN